MTPSQAAARNFTESRRLFEVSLAKRPLDHAMRCGDAHLIPESVSPVAAADTISAR